MKSRDEINFSTNFQRFAFDLDENLRIILKVNGNLLLRTF